MSLYSIKVRFTCFCGGEFQYVDQFIEHKILKHKIEFQQIKSIVFEENVNVIQNGPLPSKSAGTGTGTTTTEAGTGAEAENEEVTTPTPIPILLAHEKFFKRRGYDNLDSEIQNRLTNIGIAVSNSNIEYNFLTSRVSAEAQQQQPDPAPVVPLNNQPGRTLDVPIKQESQFSIDIDGEEYQENSYDTEPGPCPTTGNQGNDDLDPFDPDPGIEHSNIKCKIEEFEFKNENASDSTTDASSASNLRFVDDPPNITSASASASADSLSQSSHYTPDVGVPWGLVPVPVPDEQASEQVSSYPSSSLLHPVPFEMSGPGPGLGPSYNNLQNSNAYTTDVNEDNNRHFRFPVSHSNFNTVSVPVQNFNESLLKTFYARNNNYRNRPGLSEAHTPVESSARIGKKSLRQSGIGGTQVIRSTHRMYRCHVANCSSSFKSAYNLRYHIKCKHTDNYLKNVSCVICDKRFFSRGELNKHSVVHTNDRPFHCPFEGCTSAYKRKNKLTQHLRNNHTNNQMH